MKSINRNRQFCRKTLATLLHKLWMCKKSPMPQCAHRNLFFCQIKSFVKNRTCLSYLPNFIMPSYNKHVWKITPYFPLEMLTLLYHVRRLVWDCESTPSVLLLSPLKYLIFRLLIFYPSAANWLIDVTLAKNCFFSYSSTNIFRERDVN